MQDLADRRQSNMVGGPLDSAWGRLWSMVAGSAANLHRLQAWRIWRMIDEQADAV